MSWLLVLDGLPTYIKVFNWISPKISGSTIDVKLNEIAHLAFICITTIWSVSPWGRSNSLLLDIEFQLQRTMTSSKAVDVKWIFFGCLVCMLFPSGKKRNVIRFDNSSISVVNYVNNDIIWSEQARDWAGTKSFWPEQIWGAINTDATLQGVRSEEQSLEEETRAAPSAGAVGHHTVTPNRTAKSNYILI
jgi:hypothetical protein